MNVMQINISGAMTMKQLKQALFEKLNEIEDEYAVQFTKSATLYFHPSNEAGEEVFIKDKKGKQVEKLSTKGPYKSVAEELKI